MALQDPSFDDEDEGNAAEDGKVAEGWGTVGRDVLRRGWWLGKKVAVAGVAMTSAPVVIPPLLIFTTLGLALAFPFGVYFAGFACTDMLMRSLLPLPPPPLQSDDDDEGEEVDEGEVEEEVRDDEEGLDLKDTVEETWNGGLMEEEKESTDGTGTPDPWSKELPPDVYPYADVDRRFNVEQANSEEEGSEGSIEKVEQEKLPSSAYPSEETVNDGGLVGEEGPTEETETPYPWSKELSPIVYPSAAPVPMEGCMAIDQFSSDEKGSEGRVEKLEDEKMPSIADPSVAAERQSKVRPSSEYDVKDGNGLGVEMSAEEKLMEIMGTGYKKQAGEMGKKEEHGIEIEHFSSKDNRAKGSIEKVEVEDLASSATYPCVTELEIDEDVGNRGSIEVVVEEKPMESMGNEEEKEAEKNGKKEEHTGAATAQELSPSVYPFVIVAEPTEDNGNRLGVEMLKEEKLVEGMGTGDEKQAEQMGKKEEHELGEPAERGIEIEHLSSRDNGDEGSIEKVEVEKLPSSAYLSVAECEILIGPRLEYGEEYGSRGSIEILVEEQTMEIIETGEEKEAEEKGKKEEHVGAVTAQELPPSAYPIVVMAPAEHRTEIEPYSLKSEYASVPDEKTVGGIIKIPEGVKPAEQTKEKREEGKQEELVNAAAPGGEGPPPHAYHLVAGKGERRKIEIELSAVEQNRNRGGTEMMQLEGLTEERKEVEEDKKEERSMSAAATKISKLPKNACPSIAVAPIEHKSEVEPSSFSSEYASAVDDHFSDITDTESRASIEHDLDMRSGPEVLAMPSDNECVYNEEKIWVQIYAIRTIVGYRATLHSSLVRELRALYLFTGVEPPVSLNDTSDLAEVHDKLRFLKSVIGVK